MVRVSIVIPTYNRADLLRGALESVQALEVPEAWQVEIIVVDNRSTDHTADVTEAARRAGPLALRRVIETNRGLNHGRNRGLRESAADWLVYLDDDMLVAPGWLTGLAEAVEQHHPDAVVGPVEPWFEELPKYWLPAVAVDSVTSPYSRKGECLKILSPDNSHELPGCNFGVRRMAALEAGGFHPSLDRVGAGMLAGGDFEFGFRLTRLGMRVAYSPQCKIRHFISRQKICPSGLRARWKGAGATERAFMYLDNKRPSPMTLLHIAVGLLKTSAKSCFFYMLGRRSAGFEQELMALSLRGYLFGAPRLKPRKWPPDPFEA